MTTVSEITKHTIYLLEVEGVLSTSHSSFRKLEASYAVQPVNGAGQRAAPACPRPSQPNGFLENPPTVFLRIHQKIFLRITESFC